MQTIGGSPKKVTPMPLQRPIRTPTPRAIGIAHREARSSPGARVAQAAAATATPPPTATPSASELQDRLQAAFTAEDLQASAQVGPDLRVVQVAQADATRRKRQTAEVVVRAVFRDARLPEPRIEHRWTSSRGAPQSLAQATPSPRRGGDAAASPERLLATAPTAAGRSARAGDDAVLPTVVPSGRLSESCRAQALESTVRDKVARMTACMRGSCCNADHRQSEECQAYDRRFPLDCPR